MNTRHLPLLGLLLLATLAGCNGNNRGYYSERPTDPPKESAEGNGNEARLGIRVEGLHLAAAGNMLAFRYRVLDPQKAAPLFDRHLHPYLLDEATGAAFAVPDSPKVGQLRTTRRNSDAQADRAYHMLFANPGHFLQAGQKVSLVIGEMKLKDLVVQ